MLIQKFWKKRMALIGAMVFILTLFALNLNALVTGKVEVNQANALRLWFIGFHTIYTAYTDLNGDGDFNDPGEEFEYCSGDGIRCIAFYVPWPF